MEWIDLTGYAASLLVFATFCMKTMIPLRVAAICSNIAFIAYGSIGQIYPVLALHLVLLPMNVWRTLEMLRLLRRVEAAAKGDLSVDWLKPFMRSVKYGVGHVLFRRGDVADRLFFVVRGELQLEETKHVLGAGEILGEFALFSSDHRRTQTVLCKSDVELLWISESGLAQLCYQNLAISFHLIRLITNRMIANMSQLQQMYAVR